MSFAQAYLGGFNSIQQDIQDSNQRAESARQYDLGHGERVRHNTELERLNELATMEQMRRLERDIQERVRYQDSDQGFRTGERIGAQQFQTGERLGSESHASQMQRRLFGQQRFLQNDDQSFRGHHMDADRSQQWDIHRNNLGFNYANLSENARQHDTGLVNGQTPTAFAVGRDDRDDNAMGDLVGRLHNSFSEKDPMTAMNTFDGILDDAASTGGRQFQSFLDLNGQRMIGSLNRIVADKTQDRSVRQRAEQRMKDLYSALGLDFEIEFGGTSGGMRGTGGVANAHSFGSPSRLPAWATSNQPIR